jgi:hypothetical protein
LAIRRSRKRKYSGSRSETEFHSVATPFRSYIHSTTHISTVLPIYPQYYPYIHSTTLAPIVSFIPFGPLASYEFSLLRIHWLLSCIVSQDEANMRERQRGWGRTRGPDDVTLGQEELKIIERQRTARRKRKEEEKQGKGQGKGQGSGDEREKSEEEPTTDMSEEEVS